MLPTLIVLAISTILNAIYFMKTVVRIYTPVKSDYPKIPWKQDVSYAVVCICFIICNVVLGMCSEPIVDLIRSGLSMFA